MDEKQSIANTTRLVETQLTETVVNLLMISNPNFLDKSENDQSIINETHKIISHVLSVHKQVRIRMKQDQV